MSQSSEQSHHMSFRASMLPPHEQPEYRVENNPDSCSLLELLSVIIGGDDQMAIAEQLLSKFSTIHWLATAHPIEFTSVDGIDRQLALRIKAALTLGRKLLEPDEIRPLINSAEAAADILLPRMTHQSQESFWVIALDAELHMIDIYEATRGTLNTTSSRVGETFKRAIQLNAAAIVIAHNHPSGDPTPSPTDIDNTREIVYIGKKFDIPVQDNLIIGNGRWISLRNLGVGFEAVE
jgi:DNA repair protein RadC